MFQDVFDELSIATFSSFPISGNGKLYLEYFLNSQGQANTSEIIVAVHVLHESSEVTSHRSKLGHRAKNLDMAPPTLQEKQR